MKLIARDRTISLDEPIVMGVLNVAPDSFSGEGMVDTAAVVSHGIRILAEGAAVIDVGGNSSRPGGSSVTTEEELAEILPVVRRLIHDTKAVISVDTHNASVAEAVLEAGAHIINDITGLRDENMPRVVAKYRAGVVIMHMRGTPDTMHFDPGYVDVAGEVRDFFREQLAVAHSAGISDEQIMLDPGVGFGKNVEHSLELLAALPLFRREFSQALLLGASRKRFIGKLTGREMVEGQIFGTVATTALAVRDGVNVLRVHDVRANRDAIRVARAIAAKRS